MPSKLDRRSQLVWPRSDKCDQNNHTKLDLLEALCSEHRRADYSAILGYILAATAAAVENMQIRRVESVTGSDRILDANARNS